MLLPWDLTTAVCAVLLTDTLNLGVLAATPRTLKKPTAKNFTDPIIPQFSLRDLFERQQSTCYSPNRWCPRKYPTSALQVRSKYLFLT